MIDIIKSLSAQYKCPYCLKKYNYVCLYPIDNNVNYWYLFKLNDNKFANRDDYAPNEFIYLIDFDDYNDYIDINYNHFDFIHFCQESQAPLFEESKLFCRDNVFEYRFYLWEDDYNNMKYPYTMDHKFSLIIENKNSYYVLDDNPDNVIEDTDHNYTYEEIVYLTQKMKPKIDKLICLR
ncbi:MAG: hypothetical protein LC122_12605 [Chitinophagales bacterium]|nr:hypothetical protein [Chitinophagales bacterium]